METIKRQLLYKFTGSELKKISQEMAYTVGELDAVEQEKKDTAAAFKDRMEVLSNKIKDAAHKINSGQEQRLIDCEVVKNFDLNVVRVYRLDTGEIVEERAMTTEERQRELDLRAARVAQEEPPVVDIAPEQNEEPQPPLRAVGGKGGGEHPELAATK